MPKLSKTALGAIIISVIVAVLAIAGTLVWFLVIRKLKVTKEYTINQSGGVRAVDVIQNQREIGRVTVNRKSDTVNVTPSDPNWNVSLDASNSTNLKSEYIVSIASGVSLEGATTFSTTINIVNANSNKTIDSSITFEVDLLAMEYEIKWSSDAFLRGSGAESKTLVLLDTIEQSGIFRSNDLVAFEVAENSTLGSLASSSEWRLSTNSSISAELDPRDSNASVGVRLKTGSTLSDGQTIRVELELVVQDTVVLSTDVTTITVEHPSLELSTHPSFPNYSGLLIDALDLAETSEGLVEVSISPQVGTIPNTFDLSWEVNRSDLKIAVASDGTRAQLQLVPNQGQSLTSPLTLENVVVSLSSRSNTIATSDSVQITLNPVSGDYQSSNQVKTTGTASEYEIIDVSFVEGFRSVGSWTLDTDLNDITYTLSDPSSRFRISSQTSTGGGGTSIQVEFTGAANDPVPTGQYTLTLTGSLQTNVIWTSGLLTYIVTEPTGTFEPNEPAVGPVTNGYQARVALVVSFGRQLGNFTSNYDFKAATFALNAGANFLDITPSFANGTTTVGVSLSDQFDFASFQLQGIKTVSLTATLSGSVIWAPGAIDIDFLFPLVTLQPNTSIVNSNLTFAAVKVSSSERLLGNLEASQTVNSASLSWSNTSTDTFELAPNGNFSVDLSLTASKAESINTTLTYDTYPVTITLRDTLNPSLVLYQQVFTFESIENKIALTNFTELSNATYDTNTYVLSQPDGKNFMRASHPLISNTAIFRVTTLLRTSYHYRLETAATPSPDFIEIELTNSTLSYIQQSQGTYLGRTSLTGTFVAGDTISVFYENGTVRFTINSNVILEKSNVPDVFTHLVVYDDLKSSVNDSFIRGELYFS